MVPPFNYTTSGVSGGHPLGDAGAIEMNPDDGSFWFVLWGSGEAYRTQGLNTGTIELHEGSSDLAGGFTFHIDQVLKMCRKIQGKPVCVGDVSFGDVVFTPVVP